ncbi:MAG: DUF349 domain-containing protein, partial [Bacteroidota bacterium]
MKNSKNTPQNPESEIIAGQEEIAATVDTTEDNIEITTATDSDQTEEINQTEKVAEVSTETLEVLVEEPVEIPIADQPAEPSEEKPEELVAEKPEEPVEVTLVESAEATLVEPVEEALVEPDEETLVEPVEETLVEPVEELVAEVLEVPVEAPSEHLEAHAEVLMEELPEDHLDEHLDEVTEANVEHAILETDVNYEGLTRAELVEMLEKAVAETDFNSVKTKIALLKFAFLKKKKEESLLKYEQVSEEGVAKEELAPEQDELDIKFNELIAIYRTNKVKHSEEQEKIKQDNLKKKFQILDGLRVLISSEETLKKTYDEFKVLQERWKEIGMVPRTEINNLWQNYHFLVEKFFEKVKLNKELKDLDLRKNMEAKIALCEKTEELLLETSVIKSFRKLQKYHEEWKDLGPVPTDKKEEIWERFKNATDKINDLRREHYSLIEEDQNKNLETKNALCEQCEIVAGLPNDSIKDWQDNTNKVNDLLKIWKNIGPVPQKVNVEIWTRFKTSLDAFFANKKEYFDKLKEQQMHNYNLKVELSLQAEALNSSTDWKNTTNELIRLQGEWKKIGPVPKKNSDKIWKRFRTACDDFFNAKQAYFSNIHASEGENLTKKLTLMSMLKEHQFGQDKSANLEVLKNFQREWTEIGHVPMKDKDKLHNEFRALVNEHLDKLKISEVEMSTVSFQAKFDHLKNDPNAHRVIGKEREFLATKITKMKEEITLWENNIGFFAKSKSASVVKEEFENKINKAKSELKVLEAKMKILRQQG